MNTTPTAASTPELLSQEMITEQTRNFTSDALRLLKEKPLTKQEALWINEGFDAESNPTRTS